MSHVRLVAASVSLLLTPAAVDAQPAHTVVKVQVAGDQGQVLALEAVVRDLLRRWPVEVEIAATPRLDFEQVLTPRPDPPGRDVLTRTWIDLGARPAPVIYLVDRGWQRVLVRRLPAGAGASPELAHEAIGQVLLGAVEALLAGRTVGIPVQQARASLSPAPERPTAQDTGDRRPTLQVGLLYETVGFSEQALLLHGPGARLGAGIPVGRAGFGFEFAVSLHFRAPVTIAPAPVGLRLRSGGLRFVAAAERPLGGRSTWRLFAGGGTEVTWVTPRAGQEDILLTTGARLFVPVGRAGLELTFALSDRVRASLAALVDVDWSGTRYVVETSTGDLTVLRPMSLRPGLGVALSLASSPPSRKGDGPGQATPL